MVCVLGESKLFQVDFIRNLYSTSSILFKCQLVVFQTVFFLELK